jgi:hypothetical protein
MISGTIFYPIIQKHQAYSSSTLRHQVKSEEQQAVRSSSLEQQRSQQQHLSKNVQKTLTVTPAPTVSPTPTPTPTPGAAGCPPGSIVDLTLQDPITVPGLTLPKGTVLCLPHLSLSTKPVFAILPPGTIPRTATVTLTVTPTVTSTCTNGALAVITSLDPRIVMFSYMTSRHNHVMGTCAVPTPTWAEHRQ